MFCKGAQFHVVFYLVHVVLTMLLIDLKVEALGEIELAAKLLEEVNTMEVLPYCNCFLST